MNSCGNCSLYLVVVMRVFKCLLCFQVCHLLEDERSILKVAREEHTAKGYIAKRHSIIIVFVVVMISIICHKAPSDCPFDYSKRNPFVIFIIFLKC